MRKIIDLTGKIFGKLLVLEKIDIPSNHGQVIWKCQCDCGNVTEILGNSLKRNLTKSCGCITKEIFKFKTNIHFIQSKTISKNNTSGVKGVNWNKQMKKWKSQIMFQKKYYYLGLFKNKEDAKEARKQAEERLFGNFLDWYYENYPDKKKK